MIKVILFLIKSKKYFIKFWLSGLCVQSKKEGVFFIPTGDEQAQPTDYFQTVRLPFLYKAQHLL